MTTTPQVIVTIHPETGDLQVELPGFMATRRKITLRTAEAGESLLRILLAQAGNRADLGLDGAPTEAQVRHWERHATWASAQCRFCVAEGRASFQQPKGPKTAPTLVAKTPGGVEVRRLPAGKSFRHKTLESKRNPEDLGL